MRLRTVAWFDMTLLWYKFTSNRCNIQLNLIRTTSYLFTNLDSTNLRLQLTFTNCTNSNILNYFASTLRMVKKNWFYLHIQCTRRFCYPWKSHATAAWLYFCLTNSPLPYNLWVKGKIWYWLFLQYRLWNTARICSQ